MDYRSAEDIALLNTSHQQKDFPDEYNEHYLNEFLHKFEYMLEVGSTNQSAACMAIFLSSFTRPVWTPVGCNNTFQHNYFICERKHSTKLSKHSYKHNRVACPIPYTYVHGSCWNVPSVISGEDSPASTIWSSTWSLALSSTSLSKLFAYLSAWSIGQATRTNIRVRIKHSHNMSCLKTNAFDIQHFKDWFVVSNCNTTYSLVQRTTLIYSDACEGTYLTK